MDNLLNILWNFSTDGFVLTSLEGVILRVNPSFCRLVGLDTHQLVGKSLFAFFVSGAKDDAKMHFEKTVYLKDNRSSLELAIEYTDGTERKVEFNLANATSEDAHPVVLAILKDKTKQDEYLQEMLRGRVRIEESDRLKTAFLSNMSHEIRTPMNGIIGFSGMLLDPGLSSDKLKHFVELIVTSCNQLLDLINDIIDLSKIEAGQLEIHNNDFILNDLLNELYRFFQYTAQTKGIRFILKEGLAEQQSRIVTDVMKLRQILLNILSNALKFTSEGTVEFGYSVKEKELEFYVSDTGIGIDKANYKKIFERFSQADNSSTRQYGGTGLGLSISKSFIEMLGGRIWLNSVLGSGTTFYFTIPYRSVSGIVEKMEIQMVNFDWRSKTLLVAEDEEINYLYITEALSDTNINVIRAINGLEVVETIKSNPNIHLILMDIKMPEMNGYEATRIVKQICPHIPVIAQTAYAMASDRENALSAGCDDYIAKPVKKEKLISIIQRYLV